MLDRGERCQAIVWELVDSQVELAELGELRELLQPVIANPRTRTRFGKY